VHHVCPTLDFSNLQQILQPHASLPNFKKNNNPSSKSSAYPSPHHPPKKIHTTQKAAVAKKLPG